MNKAVLTVNNKRFEIEDYLYDSNSKKGLISIQCADLNLGGYLLHDVEKEKFFTLETDKLLIKVCSATVDLMELSENPKFIRLRFRSENIVVENSPYVEYRECVFKLLSLYDNMDNSIINNFGRRSIFNVAGFRSYGNSTLIVDIANRYVAVGNKVIIVSHNQERKRDIKKAINKLGITCVSVNDIKLGTLRGRIDDVILMDDYSLLSYDDVQEIVRQTNRFPVMYTKYIGLN